MNRNKIAKYLQNDGYKSFKIEKMFVLCFQFL